MLSLFIICFVENENFTFKFLIFVGLSGGSITRKEGEKLTESGSSADESDEDDNKNEEIKVIINCFFF